MEETGRIVRYHEMKKIAQTHDSYIATGHHSLDFLETTLINMIRGTGNQGLQTLPIFRDHVFRPLLVFQKEEIAKISSEENWKIFIDESNEDDQFLRNRLRKNVIPLLLQEGLNPKKLYDNLHSNSLDLYSKPNQPEPTFLRIGTDSLKFSNPILLKEIIDSHMKIFFLHPLSRNFFKDLIVILKSEKSFLLENKEALFWRYEKGELTIIPKNSPVLKNPKCVKINEEVYISWNNKKYPLKSNYELQTYKNSLKILANGMKKKVSEIFREHKIPTPIRKNIPILFKEQKAVSILFSLYDQNLNNFPKDI